MDGNPRYTDGQEPSWYAGQSQYGSPPANPYDSGVHERPSGAYRLPDQRDGGYAPDPLTSTGSHARPVTESAAHEQTRVPVRGPEYPAVRPTNATSLADAPPANAYASGPGRSVAPYDEPTSMVPPVNRYQPEPRPGDSVYRTRRPVSSVVIAILTAVLMIPAIMLLINATFGDGPMLAGGVVPAVLLTLGLPLTGVGLYSVAGGVQGGREAWLRVPVAYLPLGILILMAAGLGAA